jgi:hypothetical protein
VGIISFNCEENLEEEPTGGVIVGIGNLDIGIRRLIIHFVRRSRLWLHVLLPDRNFGTSSVCSMWNIRSGSNAKRSNIAALTIPVVVAPKPNDVLIAMKRAHANYWSQPCCGADVLFN